MSKEIVVYFSASGITKSVAERLATVIGSDLCEIKPVVPYTEEDLDWTNRNSRSSREMKNTSFRPEMQPLNCDINNYEIIYLGFPIWWYIAPTIVNTFLESFNTSGKTIIPFATSGGSGMGKTNESLQLSLKNAILHEGKVFKSSVSASELKAWALSFKK